MATRALIETLGGVEGALMTQAILRVTLRCNQRCAFCTVSLDGHDMGPEEFEQHLSLISLRGWGQDRILDISGGEATLHPGLPRILKKLRGRGVRNIMLETNAVNLADLALLRSLGDLSYLISLHSHLPAVYDRITRTRRQFPRAIRGIQNILRIAKGEVTFNIVTNRLNYKTLPAQVDFIAKLQAPFKTSPRIFFSVINEVGLEKAPALAVTLEEVAPFLNKALRRCQGRLATSPFSGECAFPVCILDEPAVHIGAHPIPQEAVRYLESAPERSFYGRVKTTACRRCVYDARCRGVSSLYARRFGLGALKPVKA